MRLVLRLLVALLLVPSASATIAFVQCQQNTNNVVTSITVNITTTTGNFVVMVTRENTDETSTWTTASNVPQTFTQTASGYTASGAGNARSDMRYLANATAMTSVTSTFSGSMSTITAIACEFSGVATSSPLDTSVNSSAGGFVTTLTSGTYTTTNANDLLLYMVETDAGNTGFTAGSGFTIPVNGSSGSRQAIQYNIVSSIQSSQTTVMTWLTGNHAASVFAAFSPPAIAASGRKPIIIQ